ncbi:diphosphomevalonate decarboxylase [Arenibacter sp. F20364]|uniref:diphosphomevalonate/mevalonate 3,5-bisphosphate decarboxylase family protein n=1 Tax=Arenibacter sp. F20364 TaxID=2926415 RepID=UPI001FF6D056|nr:diphosphomevalonate decarboxylase [Arenibacter sp. F20364]MCK0191063.1 diphosphomevalonate decarboxylase [Arenibacter sp. F20364]
MTEKDFIPSPYTTGKTEGKVTYKSPSNIALVKYWGKKEHQIPANPSISFTLDTCATTTTVSYKKLEDTASDFSFDLLFEGRPKEDFKPKISTFLKRTEPYLPFIKDYHFTIETSNSFPHSSGIASSASGMSALALCLMELERELTPNMDTDFFNRKASFLARLGSGSACRSIHGNLMQWGAHKDTRNSSDLFAIKYPYKVHQVFKNFQDTILLVDKGSKQVSSSLGHNLMHDHPFAEKRFDQAHKNLTKLKKVFEEGDLSEFIKIVEGEALTLHAMMMTSMPYFILMKPNTLEIINKIWAFRASSKTHVCFTLDAGANVHVLYPEREKEKVYQFINNELVAYCENGQYICDQIGNGAEKL